MYSIIICSKLFIIIAICAIKETITYNVALGKRGILCGRVNLSNALFDGDTNVSQLILFVRQPCAGFTYINILLEDLSYFHYVIAYLPNDGKELTLPRRQYTLLTLEFFKIYSLKPKKDYYDGFLCSQHEKHYKDIRPGQSLRVNCRIIEQPTIAVRLHVQRNSDFELSEIEVHTLNLPPLDLQIQMEVIDLQSNDILKDKFKEGNSIQFYECLPSDRYNSPNHEEPSIFYRGCFSKFQSDKHIEFENLTSCTSFCRNIHKPVMGIMNKKECHCGLNYFLEDEVDSSLCDQKCMLSRRCGGTDVFSLYVVLVQLPSYYGCAPAIYKDSAIAGEITIPKCLKVCDNSSFVWIKEDACGCLNEVGRAERNSTNCTEACHDMEGYCGGINHVSIYATCYSASTLPCDLLFQCKDSYDKYGMCNGQCKLGFIGEYCMEQEVKTEVYFTSMANNLAPIGIAVFLIFAAFLLAIFVIWQSFPRILSRKSKPEDKDKDKDKDNVKPEEVIPGKRSLRPSFKFN